MWKMDGALTGRQDNRKLQTCLTRRTGFIEKKVYFDLLRQLFPTYPPRPHPSTSAHRKNDNEG